jgi:hypothetical protein
MQKMVDEEKKTVALTWNTYDNKDSGGCTQCGWFGSRQCSCVDDSVIAMPPLPLVMMQSLQAVELTPIACNQSTLLGSVFGRDELARMQGNIWESVEVMQFEKGLTCTLRPESSTIRPVVKSCSRGLQTQLQGNGVDWSIVLYVPTPVYNGQVEDEPTYHYLGHFPNCVLSAFGRNNKLIRAPCDYGVIFFPDAHHDNVLIICVGKKR